MKKQILYDIIRLDTKPERRNGAEMPVVNVMFCKFCGKETPDGVEVCEVCAAAQQTAQPTEEAAVEAAEVVAEEVAETEVVAQESAETFEEPTFEEAAPKKKKKKLGLIIGLSGGALALVGIVLLVIFNFTFIKGYWLRWFGTPEEYFAFVEQQAMSPYIDTATNGYGAVTNVVSGGALGKEFAVELKISDEIATLLKEVPLNNEAQQMLEDFNISGFTGFKVATQAMSKDKLVSLGASLDISGKDAVDVNLIADLENQAIYAGLPGVAGKYLVFKFEEELDENLSSMVGQIVNMMLTDPETATELLPEAEKLNTIIDRYIGVALNNVGNVTKDTKKVTIGDCSDSLVVLKKKVTEKDLVEMAIAVLQEAKGDDDIEEILDSVEDFILEQFGEELGGMTERGFLYDAFKTGADSLIDKLKEYKNEASKEELFTLIDYVNGKHEIVGRSVEVGGDEIVSFVTVRSGKNFAFKAELTALGGKDPVAKITGEGTEKKNLVNGTYTVSVLNKELGEHEELIDIIFTDFNTETIKQGMPNGSITIKPTTDALKTVSEVFMGRGSVGSVLSMLQPAVKFSFTNTDTESAFGFAVLSNDEEMVSIILSSKTLDADPLDAPSNAVEFSLDNPDVLIDWADSFDINALVDRIKALNIIEGDMEAAVDDFVSQVQKAGGLGSYFVEMRESDSGYNDGYYGDGYYGDGYYGDGYYGDDYYGDGLTEEEKEELEDLWGELGDGDYNEPIMSLPEFDSAFDESIAPPTHEVESIQPNYGFGTNEPSYSFSDSANASNIPHYTVTPDSAASAAKPYNP